MFVIIVILLVAFAMRINLSDQEVLIRAADLVLVSGLMHPCFFTLKNEQVSLTIEGLRLCLTDKGMSLTNQSNEDVEHDEIDQDGDQEEEDVDDVLDDDIW